MSETNDAELIDSLSPDELRRRADALRNLVFQPGADPATVAAYRLELAAIEKKLASTDSAGSFAGAEVKTRSVPDSSRHVSYAPGTLGAESTGIEVTPVIRMPVLPSGMYHLFQPQDQPLAEIDVRFTKDPKNKLKEYARVLIRAHIEGLSAEHVEYWEIKKNQSTGPIPLLPTLLPEKIRQINEVQRATLHIRVDDLDATTEFYKTFPLTILSRNSGLLSYRDPITGKYNDLTTYFGAWVTPNAESIQRLLYKVAENTSRKQLVGYLAKDDRVVEDEVRAIYNVLKAENLVYVNSIIDFGRDELQIGQRVRLPRESLRHRTANCLDATVLFASLMEAASLNAALVFVPGHAMVAWQPRLRSENQDADEDLMQNWSFLETTMIATNEFSEAVKSAKERVQHYLDQASGINVPGKLMVHKLPRLRNSQIYPME